jgi:drug/metabolite transporter (DMT)-like permease
MLSSAGLIFLKLGGQTGAPFSITDGKLHLNITVFLMIGLVFYVLSFLLYTYLIAKNDLGYIIPVSTALVYVFIFLASFLLFKEAFTALKIVGICLIFGGLVVLNLHR